MAKHKYEAGSLRRRARTGRLVVNRRSRILNSASRTSEQRSHDQKKAIRKLVVAPGSSAAVVMDDMHDFAGLDNGSFMIIKADNNRGDSARTSSENHPSALQNPAEKSPQKRDEKLAEQTAFSQSLHDDRQDYRERNKTQTARSSDANTLNPSDPSDHDKAPKSQPAATVVPLHAQHTPHTTQHTTQHTRGAKKPTFKRQQSDADKSLDSGIISNHAGNDADNHADTYEPFIDTAAMPEDTKYMETEKPQDRRLDTNQQTIISDQAQTNGEAVVSDSVNPASHVLAADEHLDKNIQQNWQIGSKVKIAMQSIVADAIGQKVRQLTRSNIRDMINEGVLQLPENTHLDTSE